VEAEVAVKDAKIAGVGGETDEAWNVEEQFTDEDHDESVDHESVDHEVDESNEGYESEVFGKAQENAVSTELEQVHSRQVMEPKHPHELTKKERLDAL